METRLFNYLNEFLALGHDVTLVVSKIDPEVTLDHRVKVSQVNLSKVPKPLRMYFFDKALKRIIPEGKFDISFSLGRTSNQDLVLCPGNHLGYLNAMKKSFRSPVDQLNIYLDQLAYRKSKLILACSKMMKEELIDLYHTDGSKIKVLLPPIDTSKFNQKGKDRKVELRLKFGFDQSKKSLLFLTTGNERKGYPFLLELMRQLKNDPVELIVAGVKPMQSDLPNVKYVGYAENPEELLWAADVLIHPAKYEPFGQVITESIQCGTPVLISDMVGAKEIVNQNVGKVIAGFEQQTWVREIREFVNKNFEIPADFAEGQKLSVSDHCQKILEYASSVS